MKALIKLNVIKNKILLKLFKKEIFYINSPQTLPAPLEKDEEDKLVLQHREGSKRARDKLVEHNLRLVVYVAKKFEGSGVSVEDLISIGTIGLIKAVNTFDLDKNIKLATYASRCIENEILMYLRKVNHRRLDISLDEPLNVDWDGNELLLSDVLGSDGLEINDDLEAEDERRILYGCMAELSERERLIMNMRFGMCGYEEKTQKEVADELGISQSYISRLEKRIISKLKREIEKQTFEKNV
jgi:RNA polymerase sporulation-specific sigma factor